MTIVARIVPSATHCQGMRTTGQRGGLKRAGQAPVGEVEAVRRSVSGRRSTVASTRRPSIACDGELSQGLCEIFPTGVPPRLLVLGTGGTGKTVLTKQAPLRVTPRLGY